MSSFKPGELVVLVDDKGKSHLITIKPDEKFFTDKGVIEHNELLSLSAGKCLKSSGGAAFRAFYPTLAEKIMKLKRGAQIIYPKDIGMILIEGDIRPNMRVLEAGVGSGALTLALVNYGVRVTGYEIREDFFKISQLNLKKFLGDDIDSLSLINDDVRNVTGSIFDRVILDLSSPWEVLDSVVQVMIKGSILIAYLPNLTQVQQLVKELKNKNFMRIKIVETLMRNWIVDDLRMRPELIMRGHSAFLVVAQLAD